jgi:hypothetical protein
VSGAHAGGEKQAGDQACRQSLRRPHASSPPPQRTPNPFVLGDYAPARAPDNPRRIAAREGCGRTT